MILFFVIKRGRERNYNIIRMSFVVMVMGNVDFFDDKGKFGF